MKTEILARVVDLIRNPEAPLRVDHKVEMRSITDVPVPVSSTVQAVAAEPQSTLEKPDTLTLSPVAQKLIDDSENPVESQWEQARSERINRIRELVHEKKYGFAPEVVDQVAQSIVRFLP